jgi:hypothetical protein
MMNKVLRRFYLLSGLPILRDYAARPPVIELRESPASSLDRLKYVLCHRVEESFLDALRRKAHLACNGWITIFKEPPIKRYPGVFQTSPNTQHPYELVHWSRVRIDREIAKGDIKFVWEINRLNGLDALIAAYALDRDPEYLRSTQELIEHWRSENPYNRGVNWYSNMEVAVRLLRLLLCRQIFAAARWNAAELEAAIQEHYFHVISDWRSTRRTMVGGNHLLIELAAAASGELLLEGPGAFCKLLEAQSSRQFYPDGGYFEGSLGYHLFVLSGLLLVKLLAYISGLSYFFLDEVLRKGLQFVESLAGPDGTVPAIGDWDDGYIFRPSMQSPHCIHDIVHLGRNLVGGGDEGNFKTSSHQWLWFQDSGVAAHCREGALACFRAGSIYYGHSHLDMLSFYYMDATGPAVLDGGTFSYNLSRRSREYYRSQAAHSTLSLEGITPLRPLGNFAWRGGLECRMDVEGPKVSGSFEAASAGTVCREITSVPHGYEIFDRCPEGLCGWSQFLVSKAERVADGVVVFNSQGKPAIRILSKLPESAIQIAEAEISKYYGKTQKAVAVRFPVERQLRLSLVVSPGLHHGKNSK